MSVSAIQASTRIITDSDRIGRWLAEQGASVYRPGSTGIGLERDGELIAATGYDNYNGSSLFATIAITGPITRGWLYAIFHYPFVHIGATVLLGLVADGNRASCHLSERLGFTLQTSIPYADPSGILHVYVMQKAECRFLSGRMAA
jgi:RimJ/RimL family protein N-acetyltransferase